MKKIPLILDCDPGMDDAIAIILANAKECFDLKAVTSVAGNVELKHTTHNLQLLKSLLDIQCPIAQGADKPLVKKQVTAAHVHGTDGFGGYSELLSDLPLAKLSPMPAVKLMAKILEESNEKVVIAAVGPLTNIAILIKAYPELMEKVAVFSIMGGALGYGNITSAAEFNFYVDPEAAHIVFESGVPIILAALNATLQNFVDQNDIAFFSDVENKVSKIAIKLLSAYASNDSALHDPISLLAISNPEFFEFEDKYIQIETNEGYTRAMSFEDNRNGHPKPNVKFITKVNKTLVMQEIKKALQSYGEKH